MRGPVRLWTMNLASSSQVKKLLAERGLHPRKRLGQSFLIDRNVLNRIVEASGAGPGVRILEIGPGLGVVTRELALRGAKVVAIEVDRHLQPVLAETLAGAGDVSLLFEDFLKVDLPKLLGGGRWGVVGNLPYYITTPIIAKLLESKSLISSMLIMVQREVADRIAATPGSADCGSLSVLIQYHCEIERVMKVSRNVFYPIPDVDSELLKLTVRETPAVDVSDEALFFRIVRAAFGKRRKTLLNALSSSPELGWDKERAGQVLDSAGIDGSRRGETLSLEEFGRLTEVACAAVGHVP